MTEKFYLVPAEWFEKAKVADSMGKINLVDELLGSDLKVQVAGTISHRSVWDTPELEEDDWKDPDIQYNDDNTQVDLGKVDWSKAPEGTTHCYINHYQGEPVSLWQWEKWEAGVVYERDYDDEDDNEWYEMRDVNDLDPSDKGERVRKA